MFTKADANMALVALAGAGVFHREAARNAGLSRHQIQLRVRSGQWVEVLPGVYRHAATPLPDDGARRAALLWAGEGAVLSHRSAATLLRLDGCREERPELIVPARRNPRTPRVIVHRSGPVPRSDLSRRDGLPVTGAVRTILDLAQVLDDEQLELAVESARRVHATQLDAIRARLGDRGGPGHYGSGRLRSILDALDGTAAAESVLEVKVARLLRATTFPAPVRQHPIAVFGRRCRLDFAWPRARVALECDGRAFHDFQRDRTRWRHLGAAGWRVLPVTWNDVAHRWPDIASELAATLPC